MFRRFLRGWHSLGPEEKRHVGLMMLAILGLNVAGWGLFVLAILPHHFEYSGLGLGFGVAVTAWTLGARHAFDADHIAAIDNSTRKLLADRPDHKPLGTGFFFALGHASVMLTVGVGITIAAKSVFGAVVAPHAGFESAGGTAGTIVSAGFLFLIAGLNIVVLAGIWRVFREMRRGVYDEAQLERHLDARGFMFRFFGRWMRSIKHVWQMFGVGFVFGIGFDTATEVLLLAGTAAAAEQGLPWYAVLALPLLFAGGMTFLDSMDGFFMNTAYGWAFARPVRRVYYNLAITGLSIAVAFFIASIEIIGVLSSELHLHGWFGDAMANFNINTAGYIVVALFVVIWAAALGYWRFAKVEAKWELGLAGVGEIGAALDIELSRQAIQGAPEDP